MSDPGVPLYAEEASTSASERCRFSEDPGGGVCDIVGWEDGKGPGEWYPEGRSVELVVEGVNRPCARPWFSRRSAEPGIIGAGPRFEGIEGGIYPAAAAPILE